MQLLMLRACGWSEAHPKRYSVKRSTIQILFSSKFTTCHYYNITAMAKPINKVLPASWTSDKYLKWVIRYFHRSNTGYVVQNAAKLPSVKR